ncbi:MAG: hypothetical protein N3D10_01755 [Candidatus Micrarchaeota archaeon]|nr:hypothetical protein [Candidatus Micrarchaeota archaeon]
MKIKLKKQADGWSLFFPKQYLEVFSQEEELESFFLSKDFLILTTKKSFEKLKSIFLENQKEEKESSIQQKTKQDQFSNLSAEQLAVLEKLSKIKFSSRTFSYIQKVFSQKEKEVLNSLIKLGLVQLYKDQSKYPQGVYNINKIFYEQKPSLQALEQLEKFGYLVFSDFNEAKNFFEKNKEKLQQLSIKTLKGYDKKFYVVLPSFLDKFSPPILELVEKEPRSINFLEERLQLPYEGILSVLMFLAEDGLVFEKSKGFWQKA